MATTPDFAQGTLVQITHIKGICAVAAKAPGSAMLTGMAVTAMASLAVECGWPCYLSNPSELQIFSVLKKPKFVGLAKDQHII